MIKTHKSFNKRLKITRTGKILSRKAGQNHFNAKEKTKVSGNKHRMRMLNMDNKIKSRFLATT
ncbi:50S ribosomal protein L35 [Patescibacteria group bacterium]|nr:50S ribosomal protein L35 [Patescibacteria group bacterium]MDE1946892.1 50S ribosomal protein L35 [Patescibacteria group bacterium]MDE2010712.1 50S ribosomal protein L35 [Patescibacteria group bacterium]MDE2232682.1 50S ribosomal protein L35 [Patescibacteria group bacterium]